jgi:hypothetical protein
MAHVERPSGYGGRNTDSPCFLRGRPICCWPAAIRRPLILETKGLRLVVLLAFSSGPPLLKASKIAGRSILLANVTDKHYI